jgi:(1->4)-alpha-D-glucan 1-alpha-D-glucosylmutase
VDGSHRDHVFAFARRDGESTAITCVPRLVGGLIGDRPTAPVGPDVWGDSRIMLPRDLRPPAFRNAMTGALLEARVDGDATWLDVAAVLADFPVALLVSAE